MYLCNVLVDDGFSNAKLFLTGELSSLRSSVYLLNLCSLDFFVGRAWTQKSDLGLSLRVVTAWLCALRRLLYLPGVLFPCKQNERIDLPTSRASSFKSLWHSLNGLDSPDLLPPRFKLND